MERQINLDKFTGIFILLYLVGIIGHSLSFSSNLMVQITPFFLFICSSIVFLVSYKSLSKNHLLWFAGTFVLTLILEIVGVKTGKIFGSYNYTNILGVKIFSVPLIIGINWTIIVFGANSVAKRFTKNKIFIIIISSIFIVLFDFLLEPVAIKLQYWVWENNFIPIQNYVIWLVISLVFSSLLNLISEKNEFVVAGNYFIIQSMYFFILRIFL